MNQQYPPPHQSDDPSALYAPTKPELAQPAQDSSSSQAAIGQPYDTPTYSPYPGQPPAPAAGYSQPAPPPAPSSYGQPTRYDQPTPYGQPTSASYPAPPQYDPRSGQYVQPSYGPGPYGQPVIYHTVVNTPVPVIAPKSVGAAYVLWFFLGFFGVHHFYLGRTGWGLAYLLCTVLLGWVGIGLIAVGIGCLIDLFLIPSYTREANQRLTGYRF